MEVKTIPFSVGIKGEIEDSITPVSDAVHDNTERIIKLEDELLLLENTTLPGVKKDIEHCKVQFAILKKDLDTYKVNSLKTSIDYLSTLSTILKVALFVNLFIINCLAILAIMNFNVVYPYAILFAAIFAFLFLIRTNIKSVLHTLEKDLEYLRNTRKGVLEILEEFEDQKEND